MQGAIISYHGKIWLGTNRGLFNSAKQEFHCSATVHSLQHEVVTSLAVSEMISSWWVLSVVWIL